MLWLGGKNPKIKLLRFRKPPGAMMLHRQIEHLLDGKLSHAATDNIRFAPQSCKVDAKSPRFNPILAPQAQAK